MTQCVVILSFHQSRQFEVIHVGHSIRSYVLALIGYTLCSAGPSIY